MNTCLTNFQLMHRLQRFFIEKHCCILSSGKLFYDQFNIGIVRGDNGKTLLS
jgi:hypothetical protein